MRERNILLSVTLLVLFSAPSFAQVLGGSGYIGIFDWIGAGRALVCMGKTKHWIDYKVVFGKLTVTNDEDTGVECSFCLDLSNPIPTKDPAPGPNSKESGHTAQTTRAASACVSMGLAGEDATYSDPAASGAQDDLSTTNPASWNLPPPAGTSVAVVEDRAQASDRVAGAQPYRRTVPYRSFGLPPLYQGFDSKISLTCNSPLNPTLYGANHLSSIVYHNNTCTGASIAETEVPTRPLHVRVTPNGQWVLVTSFDNAITFIDTSTDKVAKIIRTDSNVNPGGLAIAPDGTYALVTSLGQSEILVVDIAKQAISGTIPLDRNFPQAIYLSPDATLAWVVYPFDNVVEVIDIMTGIVTRGIPATTPTDVAINATGTVAYISSGAAPGAVLVVDTKTYAITKSIPAGAGAADLLLSPDGRLLTVNNYFANSITAIDTASLTGQTIPVSDQPRAALNVPIQ